MGGIDMHKALVLLIQKSAGKARPYLNSLLDLSKIPAFVLSIALFSSSDFSVLLPTIPSLLSICTLSVPSSHKREFVRNSPEKGLLLSLGEVS